MLFANRADAGRRLAEALRPFAGADVVVIAIPRGGVPVAFEVAESLGAPLDVIVVRKLGVPFQPELAMGAVVEGGGRVIDEDVVRQTRVSEADLTRAERRERAEVDRRAIRFRGLRAPVPLAGKTVIVVDDGLATGSSARAACKMARVRGAQKVILAVPVAPPGIEERMRPDADRVVCLSTPERFSAIGQFYIDFTQLEDSEVLRLLDRAAHSLPARPAHTGSITLDPPGRSQEVSLTTGRQRIAGHLTVPAEATGAVVFAHGTGSSRHSPRNRYIAGQLCAAGFATLLFDLLTEKEERDREKVFDIPLLAGRLLEVTGWLREQPGLDSLPIGYFGASTGAAAALWAAADPAADVGAVVSRGGRPDLARARLSQVKAPTLLIVGGNDQDVIALNRMAATRLPDSRIEIVPGATHLFAEPGALERVAYLAAAWFDACLTRVTTRSK